MAQSNFTALPVVVVVKELRISESSFAKQSFYNYHHALSEACRVVQTLELVLDQKFVGGEQVCNLNSHT